MFRRSTGSLLMTGSVITVAVVLALGTTWLLSAVAQDRVDQVKKDGIAVGTYGAPPIGAHVAAGKFTGLPGDEFTACATRLGISADKIYVTSVIWDSLLPGLLSKRWDIIVTGMAVNPKREEIAIHTKPERIQASYALVRADASDTVKNLKNLRDLKAKGLKYGAGTGGLELKTGQDLGIGNSAVGYEDLPKMIEDLRARRIDAVVTAKYELVQWLQTTGSKDFLIAPNWQPDPELIFHTAWWLRKGDEALRDAFNGCLASVKTDGTLLKIFQKYGFSKDDIDWN